MFAAMRQIAENPQKRNDWEMESTFREEGPFFHVHTGPLETDVIFKSDKERAVALVYIAIAAAQAGVDVLAYALMSNHFHFVLRGEETRCRAFYREFAQKLSQYFSRHGRPGVLDPIGDPGVTPITSLKQFRDEVIYVIRNPFVVRLDVHLLAYPWCSGFLYFNPLLAWIEKQPAETLTLRERRELTHTRDGKLPEGLMLVNGMAFPGSFVNYRLVEMLFGAAQPFLMWAFKNVEAQVETALRLGEKPSLTDDDLLSVSLRLCRNEFGVRGPSSLSEEQKYALAKRLKYDYYASNGQVARFTGLPLRTVDALYPLSAKGQVKF